MDYVPKDRPASSHNDAGPAAGHVGLAIQTHLHGGDCHDHGAFPGSNGPYIADAALHNNTVACPCQSISAQVKGKILQRRQ